MWAAWSAALIAVASSAYIANLPFTGKVAGCVHTCVNDLGKGGFMLVEQLRKRADWSHFTFRF